MTQKISEPTLVPGSARCRIWEGEVLFAFGELVHLVKTHCQNVVHPFDVPVPYALALMQVDGPISMKDLAGLLRCDSSFVTAIADGLEDRGLVRRQMDSDDRRVKILVVTAAGETLRAELERTVFKDLPGIRHLDPSERTIFRALLQKMIALERRTPDHSTSEGSCGA